MNSKLKFIFVLFISAGCLFSQSQDIQNKIMLAQSYEQAGQFERAKLIYEELIEIDSFNYLIFQSLNKVYIQLKEYDKSLTLINKRLGATPQDINLYGLKGGTLYLMGNEKEAFQVWDLGIEANPSQVNTYRVMANYAIERRAFEKAIEYLNKGKKVSSDPKMFSFDLAQIYAITMRYKDATEEYCIILESDPNQYQLIESRVLSYASKNDATDISIEVLKNWQKTGKIHFSYLLARLYLEGKYFDEAYKVYLKIDDTHKSQGSELYNFGQMLFRLGEMELASKVFKEIVDRYSNSPFTSNARFSYAKTLHASIELKNSIQQNWKPYKKLIKGKVGEYIPVLNAYEEVIKIYPNSETAIDAQLQKALINYYYVNDKEKAVNELINISNNFPLFNSASISMYELANIYLLQGELEKSIYWYERMLNSPRGTEPEKNLAKFKLGKAYFYKSNFEKSNSYLQEVIKNLKDNNANDAIELSIIINTAKNDSLMLSEFAKAEFLAEQQKFNEASAIFSAIAQKPNAIILKPYAEIKNAEVIFAEGNIEESINLFNKIAYNQDMKELSIYADYAAIMIARIYYYELNDFVKSKEECEKILVNFPNSLYLDEAREIILIIRNKTS